MAPKHAEIAGLAWLPGVVRRYPVLVACLVLFLFAVALYASTMAPGLTWKNEGGDGGDFLAAAHTWGIPHPTGYPTYIVLLRLFSELVWFGDEALAGNLFSALTGAAAAPFFFLAARKLLLRLPLTETKGRSLPFAVALVIALGFTTSNLLWRQSTITEVYALNALFVCLFIWLGLRARSQIERSESSVGTRAVMALVLAIALGNHVAVVFVAVPFGAWVYWPLLAQNWRGLLSEWQPVIALLAGLSMYVYAPVASSQDPPLNWFFPDSLPGFWTVISGSLYQDYLFGLPREEFDNRIISSFDLWLTQFTALGAMLGLAGALFLWERLRGFVIASAVTFFGLFVYAISYLGFDSYVLLIPAFVVFGLLTAAGLLNLTVSISNAAERNRQGWLARNKQRVAPAIIGAAVIGIPLWSLAFNYSDIDISDDTEAEEYVDSAFAVAGPGSIIIAEDIPTFSLWYQSLVAQPEQDVAIIATFLLDFDWYWEHIQRQFPERVPQDTQGGGVLRLRAIGTENLGVVPVFLTREDASYSSLFNLVEDGPLWRVTG